MSLPLEQGAKYMGPSKVTRIPKSALPIGQAKSLREMEADFAFFSMGIPYIFGRFSDMLLKDLMVANNRDIPIYFRRFRFPIFADMTTPDNDAAWNSVLMAVPKGDWEAFSGFMLSIVARVHGHQAVISYPEQIVTIADPLACEHNAIWAPEPTMTISVFCAVSNMAGVAISQEGVLPRVVPCPGNPSLQEIATLTTDLFR